MTKEESEILLQKAIKLEEKNEDKAIEIYHEIIAKNEAWSIPYYNLGLIYKYRLDWESSYKYNLRATELNKDDKAAWWNLGIASTALKKWKAAREAWNGFGFGLEVKENEVSMDLGLAPIRLTNNEVVWTQRICPARAYIENVPLKDSGYRYNDLILNDGAPNGKRIYDGKEYSVFDELEIIEKSNFKTYSFGVTTTNEDKIEALREMCYNAGVGFENWTQSVRVLCKQCSEGVPHEHHDNELEKKHHTQKFTLAMAAKTSIQFDNILDKWTEHNSIDINWID